MTYAWQLHGNCMATAWQLHGNCMATARRILLWLQWQGQIQHGNCMATAWQLRSEKTLRLSGKAKCCMATAWQVHGKCMSHEWREHGSRYFAWISPSSHEWRENGSRYFAWISPSSHECYDSHADAYSAQATAHVLAQDRLVAVCNGSSKFLVSKGSVAPKLQIPSTAANGCSTCNCNSDCFRPTARLKIECVGGESG